MSLYALPSSWRDEGGRSVRLEEWRGRCVVLAMAYTGCQRTCPATFAALDAIQRHATEHDKTIEVVVVSLDPDHDTPAALATFRRRRGLSAGNWHFLTGSLADTRQLADLVGIWFSKPEDHIFHSFRIVVLDPAGEIRHVIDWDHRDPDLALR